MADGPSPLEVAAASGEKMPTGLSFPDQFMFQSLRSMYAAYRSGAITREQARVEKNMMIQEYRQMKLWECIYRETADMRNNLSSALTQINKDGCPHCKQVAEIFDGRR